MSGFAFSKAGDSFFSSIMSGLFSVAIVSVPADAAQAAVASAAPAKQRAAASSIFRCMACLLCLFEVSSVLRFVRGPSRRRCIPHARA